MAVTGTHERTATGAPGFMGHFGAVLARTLIGGGLVCVLACMGGDGAGVLGADPRFAEVERPWPFFQSFHAGYTTVDGLKGALPAVIALLLVLKIFIDAGTARWLANPFRDDRTQLGMVLSEGWGHWWAYFRLTILTAIVLVAGLVVVAGAIGAVAAGQGADATAFDTGVITPAKIAGVGLLWAGFVGTLGIWAKGHMAVRGTKRSITAIWFGLTAAVRRPLSTIAIYALLLGPTVGMTLLTARLRLDEAGLGESGFLAVGLTGALLQAIGWYIALNIGTRGRAVQLG